MAEPNALFTDNAGLVYYIINKHYSQLLNDKDIVQCGMIGLWKASETYRPDAGAKFITYAHRCITNEIGMELRRCNKRIETVSLSEELAGFEKPVQVEDMLVDKRCGDLASYSALKTAIGRLPRKQSTVLLYWCAGYKQPEIAAELHVSQPYCSRLLSRARKSLKEVIYACDGETQSRR